MHRRIIGWLWTVALGVAADVDGTTDRASLQAILDRVRLPATQQRSNATALPTVGASLQPILPRVVRAGATSQPSLHAVAKWARRPRFAAIPPHTEARADGGVQASA